MAKQYLNVAYKDKDLVKRLGGRWDPSVKRWYCPQGSELARIYGWRAAKTQLGERAEGNLIAAAEAQRRDRQIRVETGQLSLLG